MSGIDMVEITEAFASVVLAPEREPRPDMATVNPERRGHRTGPPARWQRVDGTLMATAHGIRRAYDRILADVGLSLPEASLLAHLAEIEPRPQSVPARSLGSGRAVMGARIDTRRREPRAARG